MERCGDKMDGVTILNTYYEYTNSDAAFLAFVIAGLSLFVGLGVAAFVYKERLLGCVMIIGSTLLICVTLNAISKVEHIQATVDDSVSWVALTNRYEIIKTDGKIITLIEKEHNGDEQP